MKFVTSVTGSVVIRATEDDVLPEKGIASADLINCVAGLYDFTSRPHLPQGTNVVLPFLAFSNGKLTRDDETIPIPQLMMISNADVISAQNTDLAEDVARDFMTNLDKLLGFRYKTAPMQLTYLSNIVVELEHLPNNSTITRVAEIISGYIGKPNALKRLFFGEGDVQQQQLTTSLEAIDRVDFIIERRAGISYESNRFFCSAPLSTSEHIKALSEFDEAFTSK